MSQLRIPELRPLIFTFVFVSFFSLFAKSLFDKKGFDHIVLLIGNMIVFGVCFASFLLTQKSLSSANSNSFVRAMYGGFIIKFFVLAITAFVYIILAGKEVNKPALFTCMGLYIVYTSLEVSALLRLLKQKKNA